MRFAAFFLAILFAFPSAAFAHATPVESFPASGAQLFEAPQEITIRFSERLEGGSSRIQVAHANGDDAAASEARVSPNDPRSLSIPLTPLGEGVYIASWSVVSSDDGHFTKGSFAFSIGSSTPPSSAADSIVIQITGYKEAGAMFVEFLGNSILWGVLLMFALVLRPLLRREQFREYAPLVARIYRWSLIAGVALGISGALAQIVVKTSELASLHGTAIREALAMYLGTAAGSATLFRAGALLALAAVFVIARRRILQAERFSLGEAALFVCLLAFAYFRATVSHATANPFFPEFSVFVNVLHLIEKDLWLGILIVLLALMLSPARSLAFAAIPRTFALLAFNLALLSLTASYIIWLHLKDFANISSTLWGENFLRLLSAAIVLVALRAYHVLGFRFWREKVTTFLSSTLGAEACAAAFVVFFSSLVIITSPPLHDARTHFEARNNGGVIALEASPYEDNALLLTVPKYSGEPIVLIGGEGGLQVSLAKRSEAGYVFPEALIPQEETPVRIIAPSLGGYDINAEFRMSASDFVPSEGHGRTFDSFTLIMLALALAGCALAWVLHLFSPKETRDYDRCMERQAQFASIGATLAILFITHMAAASLDAFGNDFKRLCLADGNVWHVMLPMKAGVAVSSVPHEGCMLSSGTYMFADKREYEYLRALPPADVSLIAEPVQLVSGEPAQLLFSLKETDGSPAKLSLEHERILHVLIVSADMTEFAHVHPDDASLSRETLNSSDFVVTHTFPKAGRYIVAVDYLHGLVHESRQFVVEVSGESGQEDAMARYPVRGEFQGYDVEFGYVPPLVGDISTLRFAVRKDGAPVTDLQPYLGAAMHVALVKDDLSTLVHTHGEVHPPGYTGPISTTHNHVPPPTQFGPLVEAHAAFPSPGIYTVFGEFKRGEEIVTTRFTVRVEE